MKKVKQIKGKLPLLLITAILILCAGFFIVSCGSDPELKGVIADLGAYAVDFNKCPGDYCYGTADADPDATGKESIPDISASEITIEAWIKRSTASSVTGGVFSRLSNDGGAVLYVKDNEPRFAIRRQINPSSIEDSVPDENASIDYVVKSTVTLAEATWTHIAGVLTNSDHSAVHSTACIDVNDNSTPTVAAQTPHLDIYINGAFENCATTFGNTWITTVIQNEGQPDEESVTITKDDTKPTKGQFADNPVTEKLAIGNIGDTIFRVRSGTSTPILEVEYTNNLAAVIDEVRFWLTGKSADDINECINKELGYGGTCSRADSNLAAYYRLNEGTGSILTDFSGYGFAGGLSYRDSAGDEHSWENAYDDDAWVPGASDLSRAD